MDVGAGAALTLVRALVEPAALPVGTVRVLRAEVDCPDRDPDGLLGIALRAPVPARPR